MKKKRSRRKSNAWRNIVWVIGSLAVIAVITGIYALSLDDDAAGDQPKIPAILEGRWQRPDGGYLLELTGIGPTGVVKASYFNPRAINVSRSQWKKKEGRLELFVELRDVNYPGSTYTLTYQPKKDRLYGIYYQAAMGRMYEVEFVRTK